jgi:hypothetical protein
MSYDDAPYGLTERLLLYLSANPGAARSSIINHLTTRYSERHDSIAGALRLLETSGRATATVSYYMRNADRLDVGPVRYWLTYKGRRQAKQTSLVNASSMKDNPSLNESC